MTSLFTFIKRWRFELALSGVLLTFFSFGLYHLDDFTTADEHYWVHERIPQYWNAMITFDWDKTLINDKPGVSLAIITAPISPLLATTNLACEERDGWYFDCHPETTATLYQTFRLPILIANTLLLALFFMSVRVLTTSSIALFATILAGSSPVIIGMTQIVNPDALLVLTLPVGFLSWLAFRSRGLRRFFWLAIITFSLTLLSKYTALFGFFFILGAEYLLILLGQFPKLPPKHYVRFLFALFSLPLIALTLLVPEFILFPQKLVAYLTVGTDSWYPWIGFGVFLIGWWPCAQYFLHHPDLANRFGRFLTRFASPFFAGLILLTLSLIISRNFFPTWGVFDTIPFDIKDLTDARYYLSRPLSFVEAAWLEWNPLVFATPALTLILVLFAWGNSLFKNKSRLFSLILLLSLFITLFPLALIFSNVLATPRYLMIVYPILALLGAIGFAVIAESHLFHKRVWYLGLVLWVISFGSAWQSAPYYLNYTNALLPKTSLISDSWGYGGYEAAQYLNALSNAPALTVWSDYYGVCEFFVGRCLTAYTFDKGTIKPDYYVLTRRGKIRYMSRYERWERQSGLTAYRYYGDPRPEWELAINGRSGNFVKVFKVKP